MKSKLHLCCGDVYLNDYHNVDIVGKNPNGSNPNATNLNTYYTEEFGAVPREPIVDEILDIRKGVPYPNESIDEIVMISAIEHFTRDEAKFIVDEVHRILKPGGRYIVDFPDILATVTHYYRTDPEFMIRLIYGSYKNSHCVHRWGYTELTFLELADISKWKSIEFQTVVKHDYPMTGAILTK